MGRETDHQTFTGTIRSDPHRRGVAAYGKSGSTKNPSLSRFIRSLYYYVVFRLTREKKTPVRAETRRSSPRSPHTGATDERYRPPRYTRPTLSYKSAARSQQACPSGFRVYRRGAMSGATRAFTTKDRRRRRRGQPRNAVCPPVRGGRLVCFSGPQGRGGRRRAADLSHDRARTILLLFTRPIYRRRHPRSPAPPCLLPLTIRLLI